MNHGRCEMLTQQTTRVFIGRHWLTPFTGATWHGAAVCGDNRALTTARAYVHRHVSAVAPVAVT